MMSNRQMIYLDNNATTAALPEVVEAVVDIMTARFSNPSSAHHRGGIGRRALRTAREQVARLIGSTPEEVVFTSGGTEGNNMVAAAAAGEGLAIAHSAGDHASIIEPARWHVGESIPIPMLPSGMDLRVLECQVSIGCQSRHELGTDFRAEVVGWRFSSRQSCVQALVAVMPNERFRRHHGCLVLPQELHVTADTPPDLLQHASPHDFHEEDQAIAVR